MTLPAESDTKAPELFGGYCLACGHRVLIRFDAAGRCPECGGSLQGAVDEARRIERDPRGAAMLAWSLTGLAVAITVQGAALALCIPLAVMNSRRNLELLSLPPYLEWVMRSLMHCLAAVVGMAGIVLASVLVVLAMCGMWRVGVLRRSVLVSGSAVILFATIGMYAQLSHAAPLDWSHHALVIWLVPAFSQRWFWYIDGWRELLALLAGDLAFLALVLFAVRALRRWRSPTPRRALAAILVLTWFAFSVSLLRMALVLLERPETFSLLPTTLSDTIGSAKLLSQHGAWSAWPMSIARVSALLWVGWLLCGTASGMHTMIAVRSSTPTLLTRLAGRPIVWHVVVGVSCAALTLVFLPVRVFGGAPPYHNVRWDESTSAFLMAIPLLLPFIGAALFHKARFGAALALTALLGLATGALVAAGFVI